MVSSRLFLRRASTCWKGVGGSRRQPVTGSQKGSGLDETGYHQMRSSCRPFVELMQIVPKVFLSHLIRWFSNSLQ